MRGQLADVGFRLGWTGVRRLPEPVAREMFRAGAAVATRRGGRGVMRLRENLARVCPDGDLDALVAAGMASYARYWREVFRLPSVDPAVVVGEVDVIGEEELRAAYAAGRGVILALPHMGNWDYAGAWATWTGMPFTTVAERLRPESLFDQFVAFRESIGMEVVPTSGGPPPFELLLERLGGGGMLCLLADRDMTPAGVRVEFFGATATMPAGPALLALRSGAVLMPVTLWFDDPAPWNIRMHPPVTDPGVGTEAERVAVMTQQIADNFAAGIAAHPQDWHMLARLWRDPPPPTARAVPCG